MTEKLLTTEDLAEMLSMNPRTLALWRIRGRGPAYVKLGRLVRYRVSDVDEWLGKAGGPPS